jgi:hypothetical protein
MATTTYAQLAAAAQEQTLKAIESSFDVAARLLELQKQFALGLAGLIPGPEQQG